MTSPACAKRRDVNKSAKAAKQNIQMIMPERLNTMFDDIAASATPKSRAIYDVAGTKIELAEIMTMAAVIISIQLI